MPPSVRMCAFKLEPQRRVAIRGERQTGCGLAAGLLRRRPGGRRAGRGSRARGSRGGYAPGCGKPRTLAEERGERRRSLSPRWRPDPPAHPPERAAVPCGSPLPAGSPHPSSSSRSRSAAATRPQGGRPPRPGRSKPRVPRPRLGPKSSRSPLPATSLWAARLSFLPTVAVPSSRASRPELRGDLVLGNLETALTDAGTSKCGAGSTDCFSFRAPPGVRAGDLQEAGFTMLNLANNHSFDYGASGQAETVAALAAARLRHTGRPGRDRLPAGRPGADRGASASRPIPWAQNLRDLDAARRLVRRAAAAADLVVVTMHAGAEGNAATHVPARSRAPPRRAARRHASVRPRRRRCRRRSRARARAARPARPRVVSRPARRLQPRQLLGLPELRAGRRVGRQRDPPGLARGGRKLARRAARARPARRPRHARAGSERAPPSPRFACSRRATSARARCGSRRPAQLSPPASD